MSSPDELPELTPRERDVLAALCAPTAGEDVFIEPASVRRIAEELVITEAAVKQHLLHLYDKFGIYDGGRRRVALANEALRRGFTLEPDTSAVVEPGRRAAEARDWRAAFDLLSDADRRSPLGPQDLEVLGEAAVWVDEHDASIDARTRAFAAYESVGDRRGAARAALALVINGIIRLQFAVSGGWFSRATRLLEGEEDGPEHGALAATAALFKAAEGDFDAALASATRALDVGQRFADRDTIALAIAFQGLAHMHRGDLADAQRLLDEAMLSVASGEVRPLTAGIIYCRTICACLDTFDLARAMEWTEEVARRDAAGRAPGLPGDCSTHRAALLAFGGHWSEAEREAEAACRAAGTFDLNHVAMATITIGDVRLRRGDLAGAERLYARAIEMGASAQPGVALLRLATGDAAAAGVSIASALDAQTDPLARAAVLPAAIEIALADGNIDDATVASEELDRIARRFGTEALLAAAGYALGAVALATARASEALAPVRAAHAWWRAVGAPYEAARARVLLSRALRAMGDLDDARAEASAAERVFAELGAEPDRATAARLAAGARA